MSRKSARIVRLVGSLGLGATSLLVVGEGLAQDGETTTVTVTPPSVSTSSTYVAPGYPPPGTQLEGHLPSSSRAVGDISRSSDGFDLSRPGSGGETLRGNKGSEVVMSTYRMGVPEVHVVRRGDTLWGLSSEYYRNPHHWPRLWSYNPQIQNPHWIYPGDQIRMRLGGGGPTAVSGFIDRRTSVPANTIFLRDQGYIDDPKRDVWGELVGASEDQMLLSDGNHVYLVMRKGVELKTGQLLTLFREVRTPERVPGARRPKGAIVAIKGSVKITQWDPKTRVARGVIVESLDVIERGTRVGPVGRRFDVVPPRTNQVDLWARILTSVYPHVFMAQHQIVFIDRGEKDGLMAGNRLLVVRRGDTWRRSLKTSTRMARDRLVLETAEGVEVEPTPLGGDEQTFPEEIMGEIRILRTRKDSSIAVVTVSHRELVPGDRAVARRGY
ncbi:MAG: LysM peptidoglycan-binding domain-containing protein [Polyangiaceae bacterium]|nr:LysM peptidoglycan-binding domain-containing protein [Polyangiaceae bacterium]MCW5789197.1 LysM peptidoglycan-binding domain-containing protein [Polyangiaceae bacterium]